MIFGLYKLNKSTFTNGFEVVNNKGNITVKSCSSKVIEAEMSCIS